MKTKQKEIKDSSKKHESLQILIDEKRKKKSELIKENKEQFESSELQLKDMSKLLDFPDFKDKVSVVPEMAKKAPLPRSLQNSPNRYIST